MPRKIPSPRGPVYMGDASGATRDLLAEWNVSATSQCHIPPRPGAAPSSAIQRNPAKSSAMQPIERPSGRGGLTRWNTRNFPAVRYAGTPELRSAIYKIYIFKFLYRCLQHVACMERFRGKNKTNGTDKVPYV